MDIASDLVDYAVGLNFDALPREVVDSAKKVVLDTLGVVIVGSTAPGIATLVDMVRDWGGKPESRILIYGDKAPVTHAGWINGAMARAHDFDEFHQKAIVHSAASIVPATLAIAEKVGGVNGKDFLCAVVLGMDIMARIGLSLKKSPTVTGTSTTYQAGTLAVAIAAGKLLRLDRREMLYALGIAYSQAAGNSQCVIEGSVMVHIQQGLTTQAGILSALLAQRGIDGPREVFQGKYGYFPLYHQNQYDPSIVTRDLGKQFEITNVSIKFFPCCLCTHAAISAILQLSEEKRIDAQEVEQIRVGVTQGNYNVVCQPLERKRNPSSFKEALFSLPYTVAAALVRGHVSLEDFTREAIQDEQVRAIANKVTPMVDHAIDEQYGRTLGPAVVEVTLRSGKKRSCRVDFVKGHPNNPMTIEDVEIKFRNCLQFSAKPLCDKKASALIQAVKKLETIPDVSQLMDYLK